MRIERSLGNDEKSKPHSSWIISNIDRSSSFKFKSDRVILVDGEDDVVSAVVMVCSLAKTRWRILRPLVGTCGALEMCALVCAVFTSSKINSTNFMASQEQQCALAVSSFSHTVRNSERPTLTFRDPYKKKPE